MAAVPGVREVHDLHVWTITSGFPALSAHVLVGPGEDCHARRRELAEMLDHEFGIHHTTLQVEHTERGRGACTGCSGLERSARQQARQVHDRDAGEEAADHPARSRARRARAGRCSGPTSTTTCSAAPTASEKNRTARTRW